MSSKKNEGGEVFSFSVGHAIKSVRQEFGESLGVFAARFPTDKMAVFRWEADDMLPKPPTLVKLFKLAVVSSSEAWVIRAFVNSIAQQSGLPAVGVAISALLAAENSNSDLDRKTLLRIAERAKEILGE